MPSPSILALYAVTAVIVLLVPGPAVLYVVSQSLRQGRRAGIASVLGIHAGTLVQVGVAVLAQVATFGIVFVLLGLCTDACYALVAGTVGPWLRGHARLLRGERYVVGTTFIGLGVAAALTGSRRTR